MRKLLTLLVAVVPFAPAQTSPLPAFEVASVKATPAGSREPIGWFTYPGGRLEITNCRLDLIVQLAYGVDEYQLSGVPRWANEDRWDISARVPASSQSARYVPKSFKSPPTPEMLLMLRSLLAERFQLKLHTETAEATAYALTLAAKGPKFGETRDHEAYSLVGYGVTDDPDQPRFLRSYNAPMSKLAARIAGLFGRPVLDQTGLKGDFDFTVKYSDEGSLSSAMQEQLGLKLVSVKTTVEHLAIDHLEKPSEN